MRLATVPLLVLAAGLCLAAPRALHASQADEIKQLKADLKNAVATAKAEIATTLSTFSAAMKVLLAQVGTGTVTTDNIPAALADAVLTVYQEVENATRTASIQVGIQIDADLTLTMPGSVMPGGGGDCDKYRASMDALQAKAFKKVQSEVKKFRKAVPGAAPSSYALNVTVLPFRPVQGIIADDAGHGAIVLVPPACLTVLVAGSDGTAVLGGLQGDGLDLSVNGPHATSVAGIWTRTLTSQPAGRTLDINITDPALPLSSVIVSRQGIYVPLP